VTEAEWLACTDPLPMLEHLRGVERASDRKLRLFAVACARRLGERNHPLARLAVDVAERFADGQASAAELRAARRACTHADESAAWYAAISQPAIAARNAALSARAASPGESAAQAALLRDIIGNPFQPGPAFPNAIDSIRSLARTMYETNNFASAARLAEALVTAGAEPTIADHLRHVGPHVRGCWALDLLLNLH
jgi:hypothetical protein